MKNRVVIHIIMVKLVPSQSTSGWYMGCIHSHRVSSLQNAGNMQHPFRMSLTTVSAAPGPALGTISSKHLTTITTLSSSYLLSISPQPSTPLTVPHWEFTSQTMQVTINMCFCSRPSKKNLIPILGSQFTEGIAQPLHSTTLYCTIRQMVPAE